MQANFNFQLPAWVEPFLAKRGDVYATPRDRITLAIDLARENVKQNTGGPFGAAIFDAHGKLIAPGVNIVVSQRCSILHAEMVAIALAQEVVGRHDLSDNGKHRFELAASTEPCAMCYGAVPWSGVTCLVCGNRDEDARAIGFDEGAKLDTWAEALQERGIEVVKDVLRDEANAVFELYKRSGGVIY